MVRLERRLLVRPVPDHEVQVCLRWLLGLEWVNSDSGGQIGRLSLGEEPLW